jgi:hypothetical protein
MADSQYWLKGMTALNAAREVVVGGDFSKAAFHHATATLNPSDKWNVFLLCDFMDGGALTLCHELSQLSTDLKRVLIDGAKKLKRRPSINTDSPRGLLSLVLNAVNNGGFTRKVRSQQSFMFEQGSDHACTVCKSLVQKSIVLRSLPTLGELISLQWCQQTRIFAPGASTSLAALLLFLESVMASGSGQEHKWAIYNAVCRIDTDLAVRAFATVDPAMYCGDVKVQAHIIRTRSQFAICCSDCVTYALHVNVHVLTGCHAVFVL